MAANARSFNLSGLRYVIPIVIFLLLAALPAAHARTLTMNIMGPLTIGNVRDPNDPKSQGEWRDFERQLRIAKHLGFHAVSTDLWWGLIEAREGRYKWAYYDKMVRLIEQAGLRWVPILSFHQLGGNVGDQGNIPIPSWIWTKYIGQGLIPNRDALKFKSEQGRINSEYVSFWATPVVIEDYRRFMVEFQNHFANKRPLIDEINISLGPSGELRYPSYNSHDVGSGYGTRGALQAYSDLAVSSFRQYVQRKYRDLDAVQRAWGFSLADFSQIMPPDPSHMKRDFFSSGQHKTPYGRDFFDWYNLSLTEHGRLMLRTAQSVFEGQASPFRGIDIGAKLPGVHWRMTTDRLAELHAGLIRTSDGDWNSAKTGYGYGATLGMFKRAHSPDSPNELILHFTALELWDGREGEDIGSLAQSLVGWIGDHAKELGLRVKGENALAYELTNEAAWVNIRQAIENHHYSGFTALRINSLTANKAQRRGAAALSRDFKNFECERDLKGEL